MMTKRFSPRQLVALICLCEVLSMSGFSAYTALLPTLRSLWGMSGAEAGFVSGAFFFGYMLSVPFLSGMTDRIDARRVFTAACFLSATGVAGFALLADGVLSAACFQALAGAGLAGTYMPGLKALTDRIEGPSQSRYISFYTAAFGIGTSISLLATGWLSAALPWRTSFLLLALGPIGAALAIWTGLQPLHKTGPAKASWLPRFGPVLAHAPSRRIIIAYACHCWELFAFRSWLVAFVAFAYGLSLVASAMPPSNAPLSPTETAALVNLFGIPASILGNEAATRWGRLRWIGGAMLASGSLCWLAGAAARWPWWILLTILILYFIATMADSAALTAGLVQATPQEQRGAAMAIYSLLGFGAAFVAPLAFGKILDLAGGGESSTAWLVAFGSMGMLGVAWTATHRPRAET